MGEDQRECGREFLEDLTTKVGKCSARSPAIQLESTSLLLR